MIHQHTSALANKVMVPVFNGHNDSKQFIFMDWVIMRGTSQLFETFSGSGATPLPDTMCPKNHKELHRKPYLVCLACNFLSGKYCRTVWTCPKCLGKDLLKTKMSSRYMSAKLDRPYSASCMNLWKVLGVLVKLNGMILNSNNLYLHANAARCWCPGTMQIW